MRRDVAHDVPMRLTWDRTKTSQLDLLRADTVDAIAADLRAGGAKAPMDEPVADVANLEGLGGGRPMSIPLSALYEDPANPRTEFPEQELDELAEDIRQHGILQPIVVHPVDAAGRYRIHFGAKRFRAAARAGLTDVPVVVRDAAADPYAQVAENQKRHGLSPLDLARFIRSRVDAGETNAFISKRLGMDLTTIAHHLALLELPPPLDAALRSGRCAAPRTLYELNKIHADRPQAVVDLLNADGPITREAVAALRPRVRRKAVASKRPAARPKVSQVALEANQLATRAERLCTQLAATCSQLRSAGVEQVPAGQLATLRERLGSLKGLLEP
jgi:ParB family chromosome partitioning protein